MISIIVPVYNVKQYLADCVESLLAQSFGDLQIILVDDGSSDGSASICDKYQQKDERVVVIHKPNGGVSSARNAGLKIATGEYIAFVDGDDTVEVNMMENLLAAIKNSDLAIGSYFTVRDYKAFPKRVSGFECEDWRMNSQELCYLYDEYLLNPLWNKLFKREKIDFSFDESLTMGEDLVFVLNYLTRIRSIVLIDKCLYHYKIRTGSATQKFQPKRIDTIIYLYNQIVSTIGGQVKSSDFNHHIREKNLLKIESAFKKIVLDFDRRQALVHIETLCGSDCFESFLLENNLNQIIPYRYVFDGRYDLLYQYFHKKSRIQRLKKLFISLLLKVGKK